jgi:integrase/recombinase XerD
MARRPKASDQTLIDLILDMLAAERGAAANTLAAYRNDLDDLAAHLRAARTRIADASTEDLRKFIASLSERGFKASSLARRLSAVRQLFRFLYAEGKRADDPAAVLEGPKRGRPLPKVLSIAEVDALLAQARVHAEDQKNPPAQRLRAARLLCLLETVYATGLRVSELVALPASAARRDQRMLVVRGKGGKERLVPLNQAATRAMSEYLALRGEAGRDATSKWLFPCFGESGLLSRQHFARDL